MWSRYNTLFSPFHIQSQDHLQNWNWLNEQNEYLVTPAVDTLYSIPNIHVTFQLFIESGELNLMNEPSLNQPKRGIITTADGILDQNLRTIISRWSWKISANMKKSKTSKMFYYASIGTNMIIDEF